MIDIRFFAIVDNEDTKNFCRPPCFIFDTFKKYGLTACTKQDLGTFNNYQELNECLLQAYDDVASASVEEEGEGAVIYFIEKNDQFLQQDKVLSVSKLKTLEYRIYRKLREKLRNYISKKISMDKLLIDFEDQVE